MFAGDAREEASPDAPGFCFSPTVVSVAAVDVAPPGFVGVDGIQLAVYCANRLHSSIAVYVHDHQVPLVINFLRYELER